MMMNLDWNESDEDCDEELDVQAVMEPTSPLDIVEEDTYMDSLIQKIMDLSSDDDSDSAARLPSKRVHSKLGLDDCVVKIHIPTFAPRYRAGRLTNTTTCIEHC